MTRLLLDTSAYSALMRKHASVVALVESAETLCLNPIVSGELKAGFILGTKREQNERALRAFLESPRVSVLPIDDETADRWAMITASLKKAGTPMASNDIWIVATAMQHGLPILTTDRDFLKIPQIIVHHFPSA